MNKKLFVMFLFAFFTFSVCLALVQGGPEEDFANLDTNKDGKVSRDEYTNFHLEWSKNKRLEVFHKMDTDGNQKLSINEFASFGQKKGREETKKNVFREIDTNKDGDVSGDEFILFQKKWRLAAVTKNAGITFNKADIDADGFLNLAEVKEALTAINALKAQIGQE